MTLLRACRQLLRAAAVDRAVGFTLLGRAWLSIAGIVTLLIVGSRLSGPEQGYFYTFGGLLALQVFVELGLENVIPQFASHERAHLELTSQGTLDGLPKAKSRLASLVRLALGWYGAVTNVVVAAEAIYLRAFKREPFLLVAILNAILVASSTYFLGRVFGTLGMMLGYLLVSLMGVGFCTWLFFDRRRAWHSEFRDQVEPQRTFTASQPGAPIHRGNLASKPAS